MSCAFRASAIRLDFLGADLTPCPLYVCGVPGSKYSQGLINVFVQQRKAPDSVSVFIKVLIKTHNKRLHLI